MNRIIKKIDGKIVFLQNSSSYLDGNGVTDGADLSKVLSDWGACP